MKLIDFASEAFGGLFGPRLPTGGGIPLEIKFLRVLHWHNNAILKTNNESKR